MVRGAAHPDPECCDGSDETDGKIVCPNICDQVRKQHESDKAQYKRIHDAGLRIRTKYVHEVHQQRAHHLAELSQLQSVIGQLEKEEAQLRQQLEEAQQAADAIEAQKRQSGTWHTDTALYADIEQRNNAIRSLKGAMENAMSEMRVLAAALSSVQDDDSDAAKAAWQSYVAWLGEHQDGRPMSLDDRIADILDWAPPLQELADMADKDILTVMDGVPALGQVGHVQSLLTHLPSYLPDALVPVYRGLMNAIVKLLVRFDIVAPTSLRSSWQGQSVESARAAHETSARRLEEARADVKLHEQEAVIDIKKHGRDGEFKPLQGKCIKKDMGSYTYEMCFGQSAYQISNNDGARFNLGHFAHFDIDNKYDSQDDRHYLSMVYDRGQVCWNGPPRSAHVSLECGEDDALLHVFEAEKCIYSFRVATPVACLPPKTAEDLLDEARIDHEEL